MPASLFPIIGVLLWAALAGLWPATAHGGLCTRVFGILAHQIGFTPDSDRSMLLGGDAKWQLLRKLVPELDQVSPRARDLLVVHLADASPNRIRAIIDAASSDAFWVRRAKAELFNLQTRASMDGVNHVRWVERLVALEVLYGSRTGSDPLSLARLEALRLSVQNPDPTIALGVVMSVGGVAFHLSPNPNTVDIPVVLRRRDHAREILRAALTHPDLRVKSAARRGLISLEYGSEAPPRRYTDAEREEVTHHFREIRKQERLAAEQRIIPMPREPDELLLARYEMNRLPTEVLAEFLSSRRDSSTAGLSLSENRTLADLIPYLNHGLSEVREGAVLGLLGRYVDFPDGRRLVDVAEKIAGTDPNEDVRLAAVDVLASHPEGRPALNRLQAPPSLSRLFRERLEESLMANAKIKLDISDHDLIEALGGGRPLPSGDATDFSQRSLAAVRAAVRFGSPALKKQGLKGLRGRTDFESLDLLAQVMGISTSGPGTEPLGNIALSAETRAEALTAANLRNHPLVDRMFERARSFQESPTVNYLAMRLTENLARSYDNRGYLHFRTVAQRLISDAAILQLKIGQEKMTAEQKRMDDHATLLDVANNTYSLPSLNRFMKTKGPAIETTDERIERIADRMVEERKLFLEGIALGYEVEADVGDATTSGLKLYYLKALDGDPSKPSILSVAGTEKWLDWYSNATWGVAKRESAAYRRFLVKVVADLNAGKKVQITGHSLGGGMAQYLGYDAAKLVKASLAADPKGPEKLAKILSNLEVVTWNAFGVTQVLRKDPATFDKDLLAILAPRMVHYRTPFDLVSRLGESIGPTATLPYTGWWGLTGTHSPKNLEVAAITLGGLEEAVPTKGMFQFKPVSNTLVKWLGPLGRHLSQRHLQRNLEEHFDILIRARSKWLNSTHDDSEVIDPWLNAEIHELLTAASKGDPDVAKRLGAKWDELKTQNRTLARQPAP